MNGEKCMALKLKMGSYYRDRGGNVAGPTKQNPNQDTLYPFQLGNRTFTEDGTFHFGITTDRDLVEEVIVTAAPKPATGVGYVNVFKSGNKVSYGHIHQTKEEAEQVGSPYAIARVKIEWEEGVFAE
jgi:hypothetical protein